MAKSSPGVEIADHDGWIVVSWSARGVDHQLRLDRVDGAHPRLIGSAADLDGTKDRRGIPQVIDALAEFGETHHESVALYHEDGRLEWLIEP